jgi:hypothetical protein
VGKNVRFLHTLGNGVSNLTETFNKFFKIDKQKALGNTNKAVKYLDSTPSFFKISNDICKAHN